uniref:Uncharacterized protein n=1 Tax=Pavo cristatus TaxID=9049 RepID=A0A8C9FV06_PAVCR
MAAAAALPELVVLRILELLPLRDRLRAARWGPAGIGRLPRGPAELLIIFTPPSPLHRILYAAPLIPSPAPSCLSSGSPT